MGTHTQYWRVLLWAHIRSIGVFYYGHTYAILVCFIMGTHTQHWCVLLRAHIRNFGVFYYLVLSFITISFICRELQLCVNKTVPELESLAPHLLVLPL